MSTLLDFTVPPVASQTSNVQPKLWTMLLAVILLTGLSGCNQTVETPLPKRQIGTVLMKVDFGGEADDLEVQIPCSEDSTAFDILRRAELSGDLKLEASGEGETAFVRSINGVESQTGQNKYWTFRINDALAKAGCGVTEVDPGDVVQWNFGAPPPELTE